MEELLFENPEAASAVRPLIDIPLARAAKTGRTLRVGFDPAGVAFARIRMSGQECPNFIQISLLGDVEDDLDANAILRNPRRDGANFFCDCDFMSYRGRKHGEILVLSMSEEGGRKLAEMLLGT